MWKVIFVLVFTSNFILSYSTLVNTDCGQVLGNEPDINGLVSFTKIPFASPPVGNLRWKPPTDPKCWSPSILNATEIPPCCIQAITPSSSRTCSEDCLYLEVHTRFVNQNSNDLKPVIFWIHGGGNYEGHAQSYKGLPNIAIQKDVVLVLTNYRLGLLGFLSFHELSQIDPRGVSGNYALLDLQQGLRWVQKNIKSFGGDPNRVTLLGQSSGGTNIFALLASPDSRGLFSSVISLSGSVSINATLDDANQVIHQQFIPNTRCKDVANQSDELLKCLYSLTGEEIIATTPLCFLTTKFDHLPKPPPVGFDQCSLLVADGKSFFDLFETLKHPIIDVPIIIQSLEVEWDVSATPNMRKMPPTDLYKLMQEFFIEFGFNSSALQKWVNIYGVKDTEWAYYTFLTDISWTCSIQYLALQTGLGFKKPVYLGLVSYPPSKPFPVVNGFSKYAFHNWDYVAATNAWDYYCTLNSSCNYSPSDTDILFGKLELDLWYNFAVNGSVPEIYNWSTINQPGLFPNVISIGKVVLPNQIFNIQSQISEDKCSLIENYFKFGFLYWLMN